MTADENLELLGGATGMFSKLKGWLALLGGLVLVSGGAFLLGYNTGRGKSVKELEKANATIQALKNRKDSVAIEYRTDTLRLRSMVAVYDTLTDTLWRDSVVYVKKDAADQVIGACMLALKNCHELLVTNDSLLKEMEKVKVPPKPIAVSRDFFRGYAFGGWEVASKSPIARVGGEANFSRTWSLTADVERRLIASDTARLTVGIKGMF